MTSGRLRSGLGAIAMLFFSNGILLIAKNSFSSSISFAVSISTSVKILLLEWAKFVS